MYRIFDKFG